MSEPQKTQRPATETYHVVGPGSVTRGKSTVKPGQPIELTAEDAKELGAIVAKGAAPPPVVDMSKRQAGRYRIVGPGTVWAQKQERQVGDVIDLSAQDAQMLGAIVTPV